MLPFLFGVFDTNTDLSYTGLLGESCCLAMKSNKCLVDFGTVVRTLITLLELGSCLWTTELSTPYLSTEKGDTSLPLNEFGFDSVPFFYEISRWFCPVWCTTI